APRNIRLLRSEQDQLQRLHRSRCSHTSPTPSAQPGDEDHPPFALPDTRLLRRNARTGRSFSVRATGWRVGLRFAGILSAPTALGTAAFGGDEDRPTR